MPSLAHLWTFLTEVNMYFQPYLVKGSVRMQWHRAGLIASWQFLDEHVERKNVYEDEISDEPSNIRKWGAMVVIKSLQLLPLIITAALREATNNSQAESTNNSIHLGNGNMMHIALAGISNPMSLLQDR